MDATRSFLFGAASRPPPFKDQVDLFGGYEQPDNQFSLSTTALEEDCIVPPHPSQRSALPSIDSFTPEKPLILTQDPRAGNQVVGTDHRGHVPLNVPVAIETDTFVGHLQNIIRGCPGAPEAEFRGTKHFGKVIIQGVFKVPTPAKDIWVGQELLNKPLLPASFQRLVFTTAAKMFSSTYRVMVEGEGDTVGYLNPLLTVALTINVSKPGQQPSMRNVHEDLRLMDSSLVDRAGNPLPSAQRQRHFDRMSTLEAAVFDPAYVYTFVICQSIVDMPSYRLKLGALFNLDLCPVLNGQPLQILCKNVQNNEVILSLLVWHKQLNYPTGRRARASGSGSGSGSVFGHKHCRASNQDASSSSTDISSLSSSTSSSLYSSSTVGSMSGVDSSTDSSSSGDSVCEDDGRSDGEAAGACAAGDEGCSVTSSGESDYLSCIDVDECLHQLEQQLHSHQHFEAGTPKHSPVLETALSAPPGLLYCGGFDPSDSVATTPVSVTVISGSAAEQLDATVTVAPAADRRRHSSSSSGTKPRRKSMGGKAAAAVASAAKRLAARLKSCPGTSL